VNDFHPVKTNDTAVYNVHLIYVLFLLHIIVIKIKKIVTKSAGLFLEDGCLQLNCIKLA